jgi:hypothetical protein
MKTIISFFTDLCVIAICFMIAGLFVSCSELERKDILADIGGYVGAADTASTGEVIAKAIEEGAKRGASPAELIAWAAGLGTVTAAGWLKRKFILKKYAEVKALATAAKAEKDPTTVDPNDPPKGVI